MNYQKSLARFLKAKKAYECEQAKYTELCKQVSADIKKYVGNKSKFSEEIGMTRNTLYQRMKWNDWTVDEILRIQVWFNPEMDVRQLIIH